MPLKPRPTPKQLAKEVRWGFTIADIAACYSVARATVQRWLREDKLANTNGQDRRRQSWHEQSAERKGQSLQAGDHYEPTPSEIAEATAEIRANWSEATYRQRAGLARQARWTVPVHPMHRQMIVQDDD